jgi:hypothetical protein
MKRILLFVLLLFLLPVCVAGQDLLPGIPPFGARIQLLPILFCLGVMSLPTLPAAAFALVVAVVQGLALLQVQSGQAELGLTLPVLFFLCWGLVLRMTADATGGIRWETHAAASALVTLTMLGGEFLVLCMKRGGFPVSGPVLAKIAIPSVAALLVSPLLYTLLRGVVPRADAPGAETPED